jgi:hypothetical protein
MMGRILFWMLLGALIFMLIQNRKKLLKPRQKRQQIRQAEAKKMVPCPVCGVHFVEAEGVWVKNCMVCSEECAKKASQ